MNTVRLVCLIVRPDACHRKQIQLMLHLSRRLLRLTSKPLYKKSAGGTLYMPHPVLLDADVEEDAELDKSAEEDDRVEDLAKELPLNDEFDSNEEDMEVFSQSKSLYASAGFGQSLSTPSQQSNKPHDPKRIASLYHLRDKFTSTQAFLSRMISRLPSEKVRTYSDLISNLQNEHATTDVFTREIKHFIDSNLTKSETADLHDLLKKCDSELLKKFELETIAEFCEDVIEGEERSAKNHMTVSEITPLSKKKLLYDKAKRDEKWFEEKETDLLHRLTKVGSRAQAAEDDPLKIPGYDTKAPHMRLEKYRNLEMRKQVQKGKRDGQSFMDSFIQDNASRMQGLRETIIFKRLDETVNNQHFGENWVYAFALPYHLTQEVAKELITQVEQRYGKIEKHMAFSYQDIVEVHAKNQYKYVLPDEVNLKDFSKQVTRQKISEKQKQRKKKPDSTDKYLATLQTHQNNYLNKSYILFKFQKSESLEKLLSPDMRVFGMSLGGKLMVKFQPAVNKKTVMINMIPWATKLGVIEDWINHQLQQNGYDSLRVSCEVRDKLSTKNYLFLTMNSFWEALMIIETLNGKRFQKNILKVQHAYGSLRSFGNVYCEAISNKNMEDLKARLNFFRDQRLQRFLSRTDK